MHNSEDDIHSHTSIPIKHTDIPKIEFLAKLLQVDKEEWQTWAIVEDKNRNERTGWQNGSPLD